MNRSEEMKIGIDSYCYHRFFGEVYAVQEKPGKRMTLEDFLNKALEFQVDGVSLESCFIPSLDKGYLQEIGVFLNEHSLDRVYAWGHPLGLEGGGSDKAYKEMIDHIAFARTIEAPVMRIIGSNHRLREVPREKQLELLILRFKEAVKVAEEYDVRLALENHNDFNADQLLTLITEVNSPYMGINFDSGNFVRLLEDPLKAMEKLRNHVYSTHIKDLKPQKGMPVDMWCFFACTPVGDGLIDNRALACMLDEVGYQGFLAVEIDYLHPDYNDEDSAVAMSVRELRRIAGSMSSGK